MRSLWMCVLVLAGFIFFSFSCFENFSRCRTDFLFLYLTVKALYFFFMPYQLEKGLESNYINTIQLVNYYVL